MIAFNYGAASDPAANEIDSTLAAALELNITEAYHAAREMIPEAPEQIEVWLEKRAVDTGTGIGGFAKAPGVIAIYFDETFADKQSQLGNLRSAVLHQTYHWSQGYTRESPTASCETALDSAIYEGGATVFARQYSGTTPPWSDYSEVPEATLREWQELLADMPMYAYTSSPDVWRVWSSGDAARSGGWRVHRVGTWLVDRYIAEHRAEILDLRRMSANDIIAGV